MSKRTKEKPPRLPPMKKNDIKFLKTKPKLSKQIQEIIPDVFYEIESRADQARKLNEMLQEYYDKQSFINGILMDFFGCENYSSIDFLLKQDSVSRNNGRRSLLNESQVQEFISFVTDRFNEKKPLSFSDAFVILNNINSKIDHKYVYNFVYRHSEFLDCYESRVIDKIRNDIDSSSVINYVNYLNNILSLNNGISSNLFFNLDEIGFGDLQNLTTIKTIGPKGKQEIPDYPIPSAVSRITVVVTIFLDGSMITPMIIIPTKTIDIRVLEKLGQYHNFLVVHQENGFVTENLFIMYLQRILFPEITRRKITYNLQDQMTVGIIDGCSSHRTDRVKEMMNDVINCVFIPPHSSHIFQPLDTSMFSLIKREYKRNFEKTNFENDENVDNVSRLGNSFISIIQSIQNNSNPGIIKNSFKMVGLTEGIHSNGQTFVVNNPNTDHVKTNLKNIDPLPASSSFHHSRVRINLDGN